MSLLQAFIRQAETWPAPDLLRKGVIDLLCARQDAELATMRPGATKAFVADMDARAIAEHTEAANQQHYELPPRFFELALGPRLKYSSCLYSAGETLAQAEERALAESCVHADLRDGQSILELGCGWGSLSLWMAQQYPNARIHSVSNSATQRPHIEAAARRLGLTNLTVVTADANSFQPGRTFDRIVSVEMFEHMANWRALLTRALSWLNPDGRIFLHVFSHADQPYRFKQDDPDDWIAQYFFTGGFMPSHELIGEFSSAVRLEAAWRWEGSHYQRTALDWLKNFDRHPAEIRSIMRDVYGPDAELWRRRWRLFFLATAGVFGHRSGTRWGVSHWRLAPVAIKSSPAVKLMGEPSPA